MHSEFSAVSFPLYISRISELPYSLPVSLLKKRLPRIGVRKIMESLRLVAYDSFGHAFDLELGVPDELLRISLNEEFKASLVNRNFRDNLKNEQLKWLSDLKEKSLKVFGTIPARRRTGTGGRTSESPRNGAGSVSGAKYSDTASQMPANKVQPKGAPSSGNRK